ncbi:hypothetical protein HGQ17_13195 [Nesterenkonia sp. MY13]|uniref:Uncharacterized protein n=1 Tax=Nesterenkonia sedimenti TaxID=1463632 RepID=A0A7X8YF15_9MICC|nr:hypothetical protein [Nesterenkonia sedimenti]NLS10931.1 hypothetical protein [Nesterenkonia sedimenti]
MTVLPVEYVSAEHVEAQKAALLRTLGLSEHELQHKAEEGTYSLQEFYAWETLQGLNFLLSEDDAS